MKLLRLTGLLACLLVLAGCGGQKVVPVKGTVTRDGKPVRNLFLNFVPDEGRPSWGMTDEEGRFTLKYDDKQDGAQVGMHTVRVQWRPRNPKEDPTLNPAARKPAELDAILAKYGQETTTPLRIEISAAKSEIELKLD